MSGSRRRATERTGVLFAVTAVLAGGLAGFLFGAATIGMVREQLHLSCSMGPPGGEGADTWTCADGIGYLGVAVVLGLMWFVAVVAGGLVALLVRADRVARVCLVILAAASVAWILAWSRYGSATLVGDEYAPMSGLGYWNQAVGPAAIAAIVGTIAAAGSVATTGWTSRILEIAAPVALIVAIVLQPGLMVNLAPATGLLVASAARGSDPTTPSLRPRGVAIS